MEIRENVENKDSECESDVNEENKSESENEQSDSENERPVRSFEVVYC